nr:hypothetical protein [Tanacetum cinerariifolium]
MLMCLANETEITECVAPVSNKTKTARPFIERVLETVPEELGVDPRVPTIIVKDIKEKDKIRAKTGQNQEQTGSMEKSKVKPDKDKDSRDGINLIEAQGCALLRKKFKEDLFTYCIKNRILQDSSEPSNDITNVVNALQEPFVVKHDPSENSSQSPLQINHHCYYGCGDSLEGIFFHQCTCELYGKGAHYGYNCPPKVSIIPDPEPFNNQTADELPQTLPSFDPTCYSEDRNSFTYDSKSNLVHDSLNVFDPPPQPPLYSSEFCGNDAHYGFLMKPTNEQLTSMCDMVGQYIQKKEKEKQIEEEQAAKVRYWKIPICYDDDDEDYTIAITPKEPDNSLIMGDEHLDTVSATKSDEFIKSSVENLVSNPSESEGEHECDEIYSNPLFDEEIISMKIDPHHFNVEFDLIESLLNHDSSITSSSSKIDSLLDEFAEYDNSSPCPPEEFISENYDTAFESFSPFPIPVEDSDPFIKEIDLSFTPDDPMPSGIKEDDYDSESDILIFEELLSSDSLSLPENKSFHFDIPSSSRPPTKPPDGNSRILNFKVMGDISEHKGHEDFQPSTECPMMIYGKNTPILDVLFLHFYPH